MIIVKLMGGIGNQMFQYAAGRRLAFKHKTILKLDLTFLLDRTPSENFTCRDYALVAFNIQEIFVNLLERKINEIKQKLKLINVVNESQHRFHESMLSSPDNSYLAGYWQNEKYFKDIEEIIRREFTIKDPLKGKNLEMGKLIDKTVSVGIHIRRGDYVTNQETNQFHGTCNLDYYHQCIDKLMQLIPNPHFFVFSDEPQWATENLKVRYPLCIIDHNGPLECHEDLRLMSLCKHNIIANSTFSWWGAWLNKNPEKIVIAPSKWFNDPSINTDDLIPENWIRI